MALLLAPYSIVVNRQATAGIPAMFDYITPLATLVAAGLGAYLGAYFRDRAEKNKKRTINLMFGHLAIFTLMRQLEVLVHVQRKYIGDRRTDPLRLITIPAMSPINYDDFKFDFGSLSFLLGTKHRQCLQELNFAESCFRQTTWLINERSKYLVETAQPLLEKAGIKEGVNCFTQHPKHILGERVAATLDKYTEEAIEFVDKDIIDLQKIKDNLRTVLQEIFPQKDAEKLYSEIPKNLRPKEMIMNFDLPDNGDPDGTHGRNKEAPGDS